MTTLPLPEPDTHCWDEDTQKDCWSHSPEQVRAYGATCAAVEHERLLKILAAYRREQKPGSDFELALLRAFELLAKSAAST